MELFSISEVLELTGARPRGAVDSAATISGVSTDTRALARGDLFVALKGAFFDGADYIPDALAAGAVGALVAPGSAPDLDATNLLEVDDPLAAVQALAVAHRARFSDLTVVGITGSNGKTAVKDMLTSILAAAGRTVHATSGSRNSQLGVALTLLDLRPGHEVAVIEAGISRPGEMDRLAAMIRPTTGAVTLIGDAHAEFLGGGEATAREKARLFQDLPAGAPVVLGADDPHDALLAAEIPGTPVRFGRAADAAVRAAEVAAEPRGSRFQLLVGDQARDIRLAAVGAGAVANALAAAALATAALEVDLDDVVTGLARYVPAPMRLELSETDDGVTVLNDAYVADPVSMRRALLSLHEIAGDRRQVAVLGDMRELGDLALEAHQAVGAVARETGVDLLITVGPLAAAIADAAVAAGLPADAAIRCADADVAAGHLATAVRPGDVVLLKGSRALRLERAARDYLSSLRPTRLVIDLDAVEANVRTVRSLVGPAVKICGVIKSHGYGLDSFRIARVLLANGADWLAVAIPDEGVRLRRAGIDAPVLVLGGTLPEEADKVVANDLAQVITSMTLARALAKEAAVQDRTVRIHLKVDTGMGRLGRQPTEAPAFVEELTRLPHLELEGLMTHFPSADEPDQDEFTRAQVQALCATADALAAAGHPVRYRHAANSVGLLRFPEARLDMVRPGLSLYGLWGAEGVIAGAPELKPAASLKTKISYLKPVPAGTSISYGRTFVTARDSRIATLPMGYVDGIFRSLSNRGLALVRGRRVPIVGRVCMDQCMVDVTDVPGAAVGDEVVLFGTQGEATLPLAEVAALAGTNPYEILARIDARVPRLHSRRG